MGQRWAKPRHLSPEITQAQSLGSPLLAGKVTSSLQFAVGTGEADGTPVGLLLGLFEGASDGGVVGLEVGVFVGKEDGTPVGILLGLAEGAGVGGGVGSQLVARG
mmetsp:Transcript_15770/g.34144  ORF Transcript_15770/g.34144 Transcript_15770/m.34144 type:complete len:105 (+) Transcript_15770:330-644(+)